MSSSSSKANGSAAKKAELTENLDPTKPLVNFTRYYQTPIHTIYFTEFERDVPGHGPMRFRLYQMFVLDLVHRKKWVKVYVLCLDCDWTQMDDSRFRVLVRHAARQSQPFAVNLHLESKGLMAGCPPFIFHIEELQLQYHDYYVMESLLCQIEECENDVRWNRYRETGQEPNTFGGAAGRFVLQPEEGSKHYVHYTFLADCSPWLKRCMDANHDRIADGVAYKVQCSAVTLSALLYYIYFNKPRFDVEKLVCGMIKVANSLQMFGVVQDLTKIMRASLKVQSLERLPEWLECATQYKLDNGKLEEEIRKKMTDLSVEDQEKKDLLKRKQQMEELLKKNPGLVVADIEKAFHILLI